MRTLQERQERDTVTAVLGQDILQRYRQLADAFVSPSLPMPGPSPGTEREPPTPVASVDAHSAASHIVDTIRASENDDIARILSTDEGTGEATLAATLSGASIALNDEATRPMLDVNDVAESAALVEVPTVAIVKPENEVTSSLIGLEIEPALEVMEIEAPPAPEANVMPELDIVPDIEPTAVYEALSTESEVEELNTVVATQLRSWLGIWDKLPRAYLLSTWLETHDNITSAAYPPRDLYDIVVYAFQPNDSSGPAKVPALIST